MLEEWTGRIAAGHYNRIRLFNVILRRGLKQNPGRAIQGISGIKYGRYKHTFILYFCVLHTLFVYNSQNKQANPIPIFCRMVVL